MDLGFNKGEYHPNPRVAYNPLIDFCFLLISNSVAVFERPTSHMKRPRGENNRNDLPQNVSFGSVRAIINAVSGI